MANWDIDLERKRGERLLLAVEAAPSSQAVVAPAARLAQRLQAEVVVLSVRERAWTRGVAWDVRPAGEVAETVSHAIHELQRLGIRARGIVTTARLDRVADAIVDVALRNRAEAIVLGSSQRSKLATLLISSVAPQVLRLSPVPVVTIPTRPARQTRSLVPGSSRRFQLA